MKIRKRLPEAALALALGLAALLLAGRALRREPAPPPPQDAPLACAEPAPGRLALPGTARSPAPPPQAPPAATPEADSTGPSTTIVVLSVKPTSLALVASAEKKALSYASAPEAASDASWRLEDPRSGRLLAAGSLELPRLCHCGASESHARGCVVIPHEAVVRLKLPRLAPHERLRLLDAGRELAHFDLEARS